MSYRDTVYSLGIIAEQLEALIFNNDLGWSEEQIKMIQRINNDPSIADIDDARNMLELANQVASGLPGKHQVIYELQAVVYGEF